MAVQSFGGAIGPGKPLVVVSCDESEKHVDRRYINATYTWSDGMMKPNENFMT